MRAESGDDRSPVDGVGASPFQGTLRGGHEVGHRVPCSLARGEQGAERFLDFGWELAIHPPSVVPVRHPLYRRPGDRSQPRIVHSTALA